MPATCINAGAAIKACTSKTSHVSSATSKLPTTYGESQSSESGRVRLTLLTEKVLHTEYFFYRQAERISSCSTTRILDSRSSAAG